MRAGVGIAGLIAVLALAAGGVPLCAEDAPAYRWAGRPLVDVLEELEAAGVELIYSSAVVGDDLIVRSDPAAMEPRAALDEVLAPLELKTRDGPGDAILIVPLQDHGLRGRVVSAAGGTPVAGASIRVQAADVRVTSGPDGVFEARRLPAGAYRVEVEAPGHQGIAVDGVVIPMKVQVGLLIRLKPEPAFVTELVVTPSRRAVERQEQASRRSLGDDEAVLVPTIGGDVSRVIELLPGIAAPDSSAAFSIRGSQVDDVSLVLDGLELYDPFHLQSFQSPFSFVDNELIEQIDLFAGGFTADLGDRHGGFVRLATTAVDDEYATHVEVGSLNSRVAHGMPFRRAEGSWLVSARAWYPEAFGTSIELGDTGLDPRFADAYFKLTLNASPRTVVSAHALYAYDRLEYVEGEGGAEEVDSLSRSGYAWGRMLHAWGPRHISETVVSAGRINRLRSGISEPEDEPLVVQDERSVDFFGLRHTVEKTLLNGSAIKGGVEVRRLGANYRYAVDDERLELKPAGSSFSAHVAYRARITKKLAGEVGLRWDRQSYVNDKQISPRLNALWQISDRSRLRIGLGDYYQSQRIHELKIEDGQRDFLPAELSQQAELTFQHDFDNALSFRLDAYYRRLKDLRPRYENALNPLELFPETESDRTLVDNDRARLRGVELLLKRNHDSPLTWWVSYTWSKAEDLFDGGGAVPRRWDQPHSAKFLVGYRLADRWLLALSGAARKGWPYTPVTGERVTLPDGSTEIEPVVGARNALRFDDYARLDFKASRTFKTRRGRLRLDLEVVNLTDRRNECCIDDFLFELQPDGSISSMPELNDWLGITPSASILWEF